MLRTEARERVADAAVLAQADRAAPVRNVLYPLYILALFAAVYGHTIVRGIVIFIDPVQVAAGLASWQALVVVAVVVAVSLRVAVRLGRRRGPVAPPLPWVDLVVSTAIDRAESLRGWWWQAIVALCGGGFIIGVMLGGAMWSGGAFGPLVFAGCVLVGPAFGWVLAMLWLRGESGPLERTAEGRAAPWDAALRTIPLAQLRTQSARSAAIELGVFSGDARAIRLQISEPITAGRRLRLRAGRPVATMVRRDLLGLRRNPESLVAGAVLALAAGAGLGWLFAAPGRPLVVAVLVAFGLHLAFGALGEGLRQQADSGGAHPFLGLSWWRELVAHLVMPSLITAVAGIAAAVAVPGSSRDVAVVGCLTLVVLVAGLHTWAAFRGPSPYPAYLPNGRWWAVGWYALPGAAAATWGTFVLHALRGGIPDAGWWLASPLLAVALGVVRARIAWARARH